MPAALADWVSKLAIAAFAYVMTVALALTPGAQAATVRVDDSGTVVSPGVAQMRWKQLVPGRGADHTVETTLRVAVRLNVARWTNQPVRLYLALAPRTGEAIDATWRTQGRFLPGSVRSGGRTVVFEGVAGSPVLEETIELVLRTDGRMLASQQSLQFYFEIDTP